MKAVLIALAATFLSTPSIAQEAAEDPALAEALVVNARTPGPAWWSVSKGGVRAWVLATDPTFRRT